MQYLMYNHMKENYIFRNKEEIDNWFNSTIEGLIKCMTTEAHHSPKCQTSAEYKIVIHALNRTRERLYHSLKIEEKPEPIGAEEIAREHMVSRLF